MVPTRSEPIARSTLARQVYELLLRQVLDGTLRPGHRLVEADIAKAVGTSRGPVREAIATLERGGLVRADPFVGASIVKPNDREVVEIYSLRSVLEGYAASLVVQRRTHAEIAELSTITARMRETRGTRTVARLRELDAQFHGTLVQLAGDQQLWLAWDRMRSRVALYLSLVEDAFRDGEVLARTHDVFVAALLTGDPVEAEHRVRTQLLSNGHEWTTRMRWPDSEHRGRMNDKDGDR
jgi:DNA-binding GntR family transcriptional regulator